MHDNVYLEEIHRLLHLHGRGPGGTPATLLLASRSILLHQSICKRKPATVFWPQAHSGKCFEFCQQCNFVLTSQKDRFAVGNKAQNQFRYSDSCVCSVGIMMHDTHT